MIAFVNGRLEMKLNGYVVINVAGIGYKIFMSQKEIEDLGEIGQTVIVYTHYHVREDNISLYGFLTMEELNMFELLISVSGVGAKSALAILANIEPSAFALAVICNDTSRLVKIPGLGAKSAARIVLELKDKLKKQEIVESGKEENRKEKELLDEKLEEAISALQVLGYNKREIEKVFEKIDMQNLELEDLIKQGLKYLARN